MSWSDYYPIFTDEMVQAYESECPEREISLVRKFFEIDRIINSQAQSHIVALSLAGVPPGVPPEALNLYSELEDPEMIIGNWKSALRDKQRYFEDLKNSHPDTVVRIYLAAHLDSLIPMFTDAGFEIHLMTSDADCFGLSKLWPLLALNDGDHLVTLTTLDGLKSVVTDVTRTKATSEAGLQIWRTPFGSSFSKPVPTYFPISSGSFGSTQGLPIKLLLESFLWHSMKETLPMEIVFPGAGSRRIDEADWRHKNYNEWFAALAIYPRAACGGTLTFLLIRDHPPLTCVDLEYVSWANPESQVIFLNEK